MTGSSAPTCTARPSLHADPLALGAGIFLRSLRFMDPELASELDHVAVPVDVRGRNINRDEAWCGSRAHLNARIASTWTPGSPELGRLDRGLGRADRGLGL